MAKGTKFQMAVLIIAGLTIWSPLQSQIDFKKNGISFTVLQLQSNIQSKTFELDPLFNIGIGYERYLNSKISLTGFASFKYGKVQSRPNSESLATGELAELNLKFGLTRYFDLFEGIKIPIKFLIFNEKSSYSNTSQNFQIVGAGVDQNWLDNTIYQGLELGFGLQCGIGRNFKIFGGSAIQFGRRKKTKANSNGKAFAKMNIPILEEFGLKYGF